jgi:hypothetical protein
MEDLATFAMEKLSDAVVLGGFEDADKDGNYSDSVKLR